jgi:hypothetical protein
MDHENDMETKGKGIHKEKFTFRRWVSGIGFYGISLKRLRHYFDSAVGYCYHLLYIDEPCGIERSEDRVSGVGAVMPVGESSEVRGISGHRERQDSSVEVSGYSRSSSDSDPIVQLVPIEPDGSGQPDYPSFESVSSSDREEQHEPNSDSHTLDHPTSVYFQHDLRSSKMNPMSLEVILAIIQSIPAMSALVQNMITDFQAGNSVFTENDIIAIQNQIAQNSKVANEALTEIMNLKSTSTPSTSA